MTRTKPNAPDPERLLWSWIDECTRPAGEGWLRYSPTIARALASDRAAIVLSYAIHLDGRGSGPYSPGRWFYKSIREWAAECSLPEDSIRRSLDLLSIDWHPKPRRYSPLPDAAGRVRKPSPRGPTLGLIHRWFASKFNGAAAGIYHYRIDWPALVAWWQSLNADYGQLPLMLETTIKTLPAGSQLGKKSLTGKPHFPTLDQPLTLNLFGPHRDTSEEDLQEDGRAKDDSVPASASAPDVAADSFGDWLRGDSARAIERLFYSDGWEPATVRDALYKAYERRDRYVDVVDARSRLRAQYDASPGLTQWPGYFAANYLRGY